MQALPITLSKPLPVILYLYKAVRKQQKSIFVENVENVENITLQL